MSTCNKTEKNNKVYYYNGLYTDLCGMSVEDFIKSTQLQCSNSGDNGGDEPVPSKTINTINFALNSEGYLVLYPNKAPLTDISVSFTCENKNFNITLYNNNGSIVNTNYKIISEIIVVSNVKITPVEDESYQYGDYKVINNNLSKTYTVYYGMVNTKTYTSLTASDIIKYNSIEASTEAQDIIYKLPAAPDYVEELPDDEYVQWEENNSYYKLLVVPGDIYTDNNNKKFNLLLGSVDAFIGFVNIKTLTIDNVNYYLLVDNDDKSINSSNNEINAGTYKFLLTE